MVETLREIAHIVLLQDVTEELEVAGLADACVLVGLVEIREGAPLAGFVRDERLADGVYYGAEVIKALRSAALPLVEAPGAGLHVEHTLRLPLPAAAHRGSGIDVARVVLLPPVNEVAYPRNPVAGRLIAAGEHTEGGVIAVGFVKPLCLLHKEAVDTHSVAESDVKVRPARALGLQVEAYQVRCLEGCLRRAPGVESHMV